MGKNARTFGQDLMRGEHIVGSKKANKLEPGGHRGKNSAWMGSRSPEVEARYKKKNLTWVKGDRDPSALDETSRKILAGGRQPKEYKPEDGWATTGLTFASGTPRRDEVSLKLQETSSGTSIFDPVLCELVYVWFCPPTGAVLDPFAGGSVRGIVASYLGRKYTGLDLRAEQVVANKIQAKQIVPKNIPNWIVGNSLKDLPKGPFDLIFSCPPYYDLEVYGDDPADLSTYKSYADFIRDYRSIIQQSVDRLREDSFACFVVGDIRDKKGIYRNFVSDTIAAFQDAGAMLYNEGILVTAVGSLPIRVGRQFSVARKLGKTHQNVLCFIKGDARKATAKVGEVYLPPMEPEPV